MFDRRNFISYNGQNRGSELANEWRYVTGDSGEDVTGADYFADVQKLLTVGDSIRVQFMGTLEGGDVYYRSFATLTVALSKYGHIVALPVGVLNGACELDNGNAGSAGVIEMNAGYTVGDAYCVLDGEVLAGTNVITVKNGTTTLFTGSFVAGSVVGTVVKLAKNGSAAADKFAAASFSVTNSGAATDASGRATVVLNAWEGVPEVEE
jgi:hypothetical protein